VCVLVADAKQIGKPRKAAPLRETSPSGSRSNAGRARVGPPELGCETGLAQNRSRSGHSALGCKERKAPCGARLSRRLFLRRLLLAALGAGGFAAGVRIKNSKKPPPFSSLGPFNT